MVIIIIIYYLLIIIIVTIINVIILVTNFPIWSEGVLWKNHLRVGFDWINKSTGTRRPNINSSQR